MFIEFCNALRSGVSLAFFIIAFILFSIPFLILIAWACILGGLILLPALILSPGGAEMITKELKKQKNQSNCEIK